MVPAVGTASSTSRVSTCCLALLCTSTTGEAPDTVTALLQRADAQLDVDGRREVGRQLDALAGHRVEPGSVNVRV